jgi:hypothetical protein
VRPIKIIFLSFLVCITLSAFGQEEDLSPSIGLFTGIINYQGDLKPNSFTFNHSNPAFGIYISKTLSRWFQLRAGVSMGKVEGADRFNKEYLKPRNLSFYSNISEAYFAVELDIPGLPVSRMTPYIYGGLGMFHFNPWTYDRAGQKTFLQPLSTEGQGLSQYPQQKPYKLTQMLLPFGAGLRYAVNDNFQLGIEFSQRKTFTDYLDDVSTHYVDHDVLLAAKGPQAISLAYRGDELPGGSAYPHDGEQRGTPGNRDWYYFLGIVAQVKLSHLHHLLPSRERGMGCPRF